MKSSLFCFLATVSAVSAFTTPTRSVASRHQQLRSYSPTTPTRSSSSFELYSYKLVLVRHGESEWNDLNIFTGWADAGLNAKGLKEAEQGGKLLKEAGFTFDVAYTSVLKRAIKTLWTILEELDLMYIPIVSVVCIDTQVLLMWLFFGSCYYFNKRSWCISCTSYFFVKFAI